MVATTSFRHVGSAHACCVCAPGGREKIICCTCTSGLDAWSRKDSIHLVLTKGYMFYDLWLFVRDPTPQGFRLGGDRDALWTTRCRYTCWLCHKVVDKAGRASGARTPTQMKIIAYSRDHDFWPFYPLANVVGATMTWMQKHTSRGYGDVVDTRSRSVLSLPARNRK